MHKASGFGGFGERLLRKQGWQKGEGLGKDKSGRVEAIEVKKKDDTVGVRPGQNCLTGCAALLMSLQLADRRKQGPLQHRQMVGGGLQHGTERGQSRGRSHAHI